MDGWFVKRVKKQNCQGVEERNLNYVNMQSATTNHVWWKLAEDE